MRKSCYRHSTGTNITNGTLQMNSFSSNPISLWINSIKPNPKWLLSWSLNLTVASTSWSDKFLLPVPTQTFTQTLTHTYSHTPIHTHTHPYAHTHTHTHSYTLIHTHTHSYTLIHTLTLTLTHTHTHGHAHPHTHSLIHIHTYSRTQTHLSRSCT